MDRNFQIVELVEAGETYESVGKEFGISKQRVEQICWKFGVRANLALRAERRLAAKPPKPPRPIVKRPDIKKKPIPLIAEGVEWATARKYCQKLYPVLGTCEDCNEVPATVRHHINENPLDNRRENVAFLCDACHGIAHRLESSYGR
jgi:hypothetical protein